MKIGIPKEIKNREHRVAITPEGVAVLVQDGNEVFIEKNAGLASGIKDEDYIDEGAKIVSAKETWECDMIMKVKEPLESEYKYLREGQIIYSYFHLANEEKLAKELLEKKVTAIAYETIGTRKYHPLLIPMSQVAGKMATIIGSQYLQSQNGGSGILLGGVPGVKRGIVTIIGGGNVGANATAMAVGLGAHVIVINRSTDKLEELDKRFGTDIQTLVSNKRNIEESVIKSDLVIGAVLLSGGAKAPTLVSAETVKKMRPGSVIVDVAVDQGGIFETTDRVTSHDNPIYTKYGVIHYAVPNIPGAVPYTSTYALANSTIKYARKIAKANLLEIIRTDEYLKNGVNTYNGKMTAKDVARDLNIEYFDILEI